MVSFLQPARRRRVNSDQRVIAYVIGRVAHGAVVLFVVALFVYGMEPALRPELSGAVVRPARLGRRGACPVPPRLRPRLRLAGLPSHPHALDAGARRRSVDVCRRLVFGVVGGVTVGVWCAGKRGSPIARAVESAATFPLRTGVRGGLGLLLLFNHGHRGVAARYFFDARPAAFVRRRTIRGTGCAPSRSWLVAGAPLAAALRAPDGAG